MIQGIVVMTEHTQKPEPGAPGGTKPNETPTQTTTNGAAPHGADEAVAFLLKLGPPPWVLCRLDPDKGDAAFVTEPVRDADEARAWVTRWDGRQNLYFAVNTWKAGLAKKASKGDVVWLLFEQADLDPRDDEAPEQAKARYRAALDDLAQRYGL